MIGRLTTLLCLLLALPSLANAEALFPQSSRVDDRLFEKVGEKRYYYKRFFKVYDAALYTEPKVDASDVLAAEYSFKLQFNYLRDIDKKIAIDAADQALQRSLSPEQLASISDRIAQINDAYRSVSKGDTTFLLYEPEIGTSYYFNGEKITTVPGKDFASLYFRVWLGDQPLSERLRDALLGQS